LVDFLGHLIAVSQWLFISADLWSAIDCSRRRYLRHSVSRRSEPIRAPVQNDIANRQRVMIASAVSLLIS
jgi:hypothetical protein